eukprot:6369211-Prymnesium_polylepis.1
MARGLAWNQRKGNTEHRTLRHSHMPPTYFSTYEIMTAHTAVLVEVLAASDAPAVPPSAPPAVPASPSGGAASSA